MTDKPSIHELAAGAVVARVNNGLEFLLMQSKRKTWSCPKGRSNPNDKDLTANAKREVFEETGIKADFVPDFVEKIEYITEYDKEITNKKVYFFLCITDQRAGISPEHIQCKWFREKEAIDTISYPARKDLLKKAAEFIRSRKLI